MVTLALCTNNVACDPTQGFGLRPYCAMSHSKFTKLSDMPVFAFPIDPRQTTYNIIPLNLMTQ